jgi:hypothetical protein
MLPKGSNLRSIDLYQKTHLKIWWDYPFKVSVENAQYSITKWKMAYQHYIMFKKHVRLYCNGARRIYFSDIYC